MEDFLKKLQLSNNAIEIYLKIIGKSPLTYYEIYSIVSKTSLDEFDENLSQLLNGGLLIQSTPKKRETLLHYYAIPPILPIVNYYENINANLVGIKGSIYDLLANTVNKTFQQTEGIQLDSFLDKFHEMKKDIEEDVIIQKQEIEDTVEGMEELRFFHKEISELSQFIKVGTQTQFTNLIKQISSIKSEIIEKVNSLEFKKHKQDILDIIEQIFKEKLDKIVKDFSARFIEIIEQEFDRATKSMGNLIDTTFQYRDDLKLILLDMVSNFETQMNKLYDLLKKNNDSLSKEKEELEIKIIESMNAVIQSSIDEVSKLNKPIEDLMKAYHQEVSTSDKSLITNIWTVNSLIKINEEIQKAVSTSQEDLTIVVPHLENHLAVEQFETIPISLKIKIVSSEPHTNSIVKKFSSVPNIKYKTLENENLIAIKVDNNFITIGVMQKDAKDQLNDFFGIGSNFKPLIEVLDPLIGKIWEDAYSDSFYASQKAKTSVAPSISINKARTSPGKEIKPFIATKVQKTTTLRKSAIEQQEKLVSSGNISPKMPLNRKPTDQITEIKKKLQEKIKFASKPTPKPEKTVKTGDETGILIKTTFDNLAEKLPHLKGEQFSKELQKIADLILEKRGFSVTLHKLRGLINKYRFNDFLLEKKDVKQIMENIETWKNKLV